MTNEMKNMPELRFPEFEGNWLSYALKDVKDPKDKYSFTGGPFGSDLKKSDYKDNGIRIIQLQNINDGNFNDNYKIYTSNEKADILKSCNIYPGDIVIAKMADPLARATILPQNKENRYLMASDAIRLKVDDKRFNKIFMVNYINSRRFRRQAEDNSSGSTRMRIGLVTLGQLKISSPNKKEQDIIGDFFSKLDRQIELEEEKLELLEQQKRGYMQQFFSQELRFKDDEGKDYPLWKKYKLGNLYKKGKAGGTPKSTESKYYNGEIPFLSISDITEQGKFVMNTEKTITQEGLDNSTAWLVPINSINYAMYASVGYLSINKVEVATSQAIFNMVFEDNNLVEYIYYYLNYVRDKGVLEKLVGTGTQSNLSASIMKSMDIILPSYHEMLKITVFLSKFDELINSQFNKVEKLKQRKKGLLQKMFV